MGMGLESSKEQDIINKCKRMFLMDKVHTEQVNKQSQVTTTACLHLDVEITFLLHTIWAWIAFTLGLCHRLIRTLLTHSNWAGHDTLKNMESVSYVQLDIHLASTMSFGSE